MINRRTFASVALDGHASMVPRWACAKYTVQAIRLADYHANQRLSLSLENDGATNADVASNSHVDDGAADQRMDCT